MRSLRFDWSSRGENSGPGGTGRFTLTSIVLRRFADEGGSGLNGMLGVDVERNGGNRRLGMTRLPCRAALMSFFRLTA